jgi:alkylhydroperoxidase family enzyme
MRPRILPLLSDPVSADPQLEVLMKFVGYRPNALMTMARKPGLLSAVLGLVGASLRGEGALAPDLRFLIACEASRGAGCFYSATHAVHAAHHMGLSWSKLAALDQYAGSPCYSAEERAALAVATAGATLPIGPADNAFAAAARLFSEQQCLEIVAVVALFGWFNRWNSLMQSSLEDVPAEALQHVQWLRQMQEEI